MSIDRSPTSKHLRERRKIVSLVAPPSTSQPCPRCLRSNMTPWREPPREGSFPDKPVYVSITPIKCKECDASITKRFRPANKSEWYLICENCNHREPIEVPEPEPEVRKWHLVCGSCTYSVTLQSAETSRSGPKDRGSNDKLGPLIVRTFERKKRKSSVDATEEEYTDWANYLGYRLQTVEVIASREEVTVSS